MQISKTLFKEYSKCDAFFSLDEIYYKKKKANINEEEIIDLLRKMYNEDGDDAVKIPDEKLEAMQEYYKEVERVVLKEASKILGIDLPYYENTKDQMKISFIDKNGYNFYTYLDGFSDEEQVTIVEVKATTSRKYLELGPEIKKVRNSIFSLNNNIITLKKEVYNDEKMLNHYYKLFDRYSDCGKYIYDIAVTYFILKEFIHDNYHMSKKKIKLYLGLLNGKYQYDGISDYETNEESIVHLLDVTDIVNEYQGIIKKDYQKIIDNIVNRKTTDNYSKGCSDCVYSEVCFPFLKEKNNIKTLLVPKSVKINGKTNKIIDLINNGYKYVTDIPYEYLENKKHILQRKCIDNNEEYVNINEISKKIKNNIHYPIYHLDFESFQAPLPRFAMEKPYMQSLFQFSIHIQKAPFVCDKELDNYSFLPKDFNDHREELLKEMIRVIDLSNGGTVLVYNENFEKSRIKELMEIYPKYKDDLQNIYDHIYDLMNVVKADKDNSKYYHPKLYGSYSIKKLLPIFSDISYNDLEVKNGCEAQIAYLQFKYLPLEDIEIIRKDLLTYCKQDTYSMVEILNGLIEKVRCD